MINTYNESSLHKSLKTLYANEYNGDTEVELFGHIYDIAACKTVIEIQTGNLSKLLPKILDTLDHGYKVIVVYPLISEKWIRTSDKTGKTLSCRKSPVKKSIYSLFDEITGLYPVLLNPNFTLEVPEVHIYEERLTQEEPVQTLNKRRRFKKNWIKSGKTLKEILQTKTFNKKEDYLSLIPEKTLPEFCAKDITNELKQNKELPSSAAKKAHIMLWVLRHMELIEETTVKNRSHYYKVK